MPASDNPTATAKDYARSLYNGQIPKSEKPLGDGGFIVELPDGSFITVRPAGQASDKTEPTTATVDINDPQINQLNGRAVMRIPKDIALWLQETLLEYDGWQWGLVSFALGELASIPADSEGRWQFGVDMIYRALTCDLISIDVYMECRDRASFLSAIRTVSPFMDSGGFLWNGTQVSGTERLSKLAEAHFPPPGQRTDKLNPAFIEALEQIFAENAVPWSDKPLLPIMPSTASAGAQ